MTYGSEESPRRDKLQIVRGVLEALIVLALGWTGGTLVQVKTDTAVIKNQMVGVQPALDRIDDLRVSDANQNTRIDRLEDDVKELKSVRGLK